MRADLDRILGLSGSPLAARVFRWNRANPQYDVGHFDHVAAIEARLARHRCLHLAGAAYRGVGIPDCIQQGTAAADRIVDAFFGSPAA